MRKRKRRILESELHTAQALHALAPFMVVSIAVVGFLVVRRLAKLIQEARDLLPAAAEALDETLG
jgi:uncharacterized BrkB/YihY/UPF0761 family membrane protein